MKETFIVLLPVDSTDRHKDANRLESEKFSSLKELIKALPKEALFYDLSNFMEACNSQDIVSLEPYWITYVHIIS